MSYGKTILCLAASTKHNKYCYAGKDIETGEWIRPVGDRAGEEISELECSIPQVGRAGVLDVLEIPMIEARPHGHQIENHLIDARKRWRCLRHGTWEDVLNSLDEHEGPIWLNEDASWGYENNRIGEVRAAALNGSLLLIQPKELRVSVGRKGGRYPDANKRLVKAHFRHSGIDYILSVTDPRICQRMWAGQDRTEDMDGAVICVSLGERHRGHVYKLVAAMIAPP